MSSLPLLQQLQFKTYPGPPEVHRSLPDTAFSVVHDGSEKAMDGEQTGEEWSLELLFH